MKTDSIFYQLFQILPMTFFDLLKLPPETANSYSFAAVEVKQLSFRLDGVFLPDSEDKPIYFVEVQFQKDNYFYARFISEIYLYLYQNKLDNPWQAVVIYPNRAIETPKTANYNYLFNAGKILRFHLDELSSGESLGLEILQLIVSPEELAIRKGRELIPRVGRELLELIETILIYKLPRMSREEIEAMFSLSDLKQTKVYQEALEEGKEEGKEEGREEGIEIGQQQGELRAKLDSIPRLNALGLTAEQIATALNLDIERVREVL
jgi:predicted transposase/invertase (TIGR01784 family)